MDNRLMSTPSQYRLQYFLPLGTVQLQSGCAQVSAFFSAINTFESPVS